MKLKGPITVSKLDAIFATWSKVDPKDDNESMRANLLVVPILTQVLGWQPNELLSERTLKLRAPELSYGPRVLRKRPDFIILPSGTLRHNVFAVVETKKKKSGLARLFSRSEQVYGYQSLLAALWGVLTDGERWGIFCGRELVEFFSGFDDLATRIDKLARLLNRAAAQRRWAKDPATGLVLHVAENVLQPNAWLDKQVYLGTSFKGYLANTSWESLQTIKCSPSELRDRTFSAFVDFSRQRIEPWEFLKTLLSLYDNAGEALFGNRLDVLFSQVGWPMLARLRLLPEMFQGVVIAQAQDESDSLLGKMRGRGVDCEDLARICMRIAAIRSVADYRPAEFDMRSALENLVKVCDPHGFKFSDYPAFSRWCGWDTLWNEVEETQVCDELEYATRKKLCILDPKEPEKITPKQ